MDDQVRARSPEPPDPERIRFGVFEMDLRSGELRKSGVLLKLAPQPFQLLALIARSRGDVLTRDEIRRRLWGDGTFVDFDQRLNSCVNQIRQVLSDDAEAPRFVETLPKRGYRWLAAVETVAPPLNRPALHVVVPFGGRAEPAAAALAPSAAPAEAPAKRSAWRVGLPWLIAAAAIAIAAWQWATRPTANGSASWKRVTFQRGTVLNARFGPSGEIVYRAAWEGGERELFLATLASADARRLEFQPLFSFVGLSSQGEMAFMRPDKPTTWTLVRQPMGGGAPRDVLKDVLFADWMPDGKDFAVVRAVSGSRRVEFPIGHDVGEIDNTTGIRVSPDGERLALLEHPVAGDDGGFVLVIDKSGARTRVTTRWASLQGLAWSPRGDEIWFGGVRAGGLLGVQATSLGGRERTVLQTGSRLVVKDIDAAGRLLLDSGTSRIGVRFARSGESERDLSWLDITGVIQLTPDGRQALLYESGDGGGPDYAIYLRPTDGSPPSRLGSGRPTALSPDGQWVLAIPIRDPNRIDLIPTGAGQRRVLKHDGFVRYDWAGFLGDARHVLFTAMRKDSDRWEAFVQDLDGGSPPRGIGSFTLHRNTLSPDGRKLVKRCASAVCVLDLQTGEEKPLDGVGAEAPLFWDADGRHLFIREAKPLPAAILRLDTVTGKRTPWRELQPADGVGVSGITEIVGTADGSAYAYTYGRRVSELFVVEGLR